MSTNSSFAFSAYLTIGIDPLAPSKLLHSKNYLQSDDLDKDVQREAFERNGLERYLPSSVSETTVAAEEAEGTQRLEKEEGRKEKEGKEREERFTVQF
jgi:hypothetical protein